MISLSSSLLFFTVIIAGVKMHNLLQQFETQRDKLRQSQFKCYGYYIWACTGRLQLDFLNAALEVRFF